MVSTSVLAAIRPRISLNFCNGCTETHIYDYVPCPGARSNVTGAVAAVVEIVLDSSRHFFSGKSAACLVPIKERISKLLQT